MPSEPFFLQRTLVRCATLDCAPGALACKVALLLTGVYAGTSAQAASPHQHGIHLSASRNCLVVSSGKQPVLRWCESKRNYAYEILTWDKKWTFEKEALAEELRGKATQFLQSECSSHTLAFAEARVSLWLSVPDSGMELATPRVGLRLMSSRADLNRTEQNLVFSQTWTTEWSLSDSNMHVLGSERYESTSGQSVSGVTPEEIMFSLRHLKGSVPDSEVIGLLERAGVRLGPRLSPTSRRFLGYTKRYHENKTVSQILSDANFPELFEWIEPNYRIESIGERILLLDFELPPPPGPPQTNGCFAQP